MTTKAIIITITSVIATALILWGAITQTRLNRARMELEGIKEKLELSEKRASQIQLRERAAEESLTGYIERLNEIGEQKSAEMESIFHDNSADTQDWLFTPLPDSIRMCISQGFATP